MAPAAVAHPSLDRWDAERPAVSRDVVGSLRAKPWDFGARGFTRGQATSGGGGGGEVDAGDRAGQVGDGLGVGEDVDGHSGMNVVAVALDDERAGTGADGIGQAGEGAGGGGGGDVAGERVVNVDIGRSVPL